MKLDFDIKYRPQIESGEYKVETREGDPVRIICWDMAGTAFPVIGLVTRNNCESAGTYNNLGAYLFSGDDSGCERSLVVVAPELTEFEKELLRLLKSAQASKEEITEADAIELGGHLLDLAREQMMKDAVIGEVVSLGFGSTISVKPEELLSLLEGFTQGDKVKLIIVKKD